MISWVVLNGKKLPVFEQLIYINDTLWGLQKLSDGYSIYMNHNPEKKLRWIMHIYTVQDVPMKFYHDDSGYHLGEKDGNGYTNFQFPDDDKRFTSCFADKMDMSSAVPIPPEEIQKWDKEIQEMKARVPDDTITI